jgi:glutathione S-transferase
MTEPALVLYAPDYASVRVIACSPPSWMVHLLLVEKQLDHRVVWLDFARGEHRSAEMLAKNPRGTIPVLTDRGEPVYETFAILAYLELTYPEPAFLPSTPAARARGLTRLHESAHVKDAGMALFAHLMSAAPDDPRTVELWTTFDRELARWEAYLGESAYAAGDKLGLADLALFTYVATAAQLGWALGSHPRLAAHHERLARRPAVQATWPATWPENRS